MFLHKLLVVVVGMCSLGCASILGADDYKVSADSTAGAGGSATTGGSGTMTGTGGAGGVGLPDAGGPPTACSGANPAGTRMCGPGRTCRTRVDCAYGCFPSGSEPEGAACISSTDCSVGMTCISYSATLFACRILCALDADCPSGSRCIESFSCNGSTAGRYCSKPCSDVTTAGAAACAAGFKCDFGCTPQGPSATTCDWGAGPLRSGACTEEGDCAVGYNCIGNICSQTCRTNADCTAGGACTGSILCGTTATGFHYCI